MAGSGAAGTAPGGAASRAAASGAGSPSPAAGTCSGGACSTGTSGATSSSSSSSSSPPPGVPAAKSGKAGGNTCRAKKGCATGGGGPGGAPCWTLCMVVDSDSYVCAQHLMSTREASTRLSTTQQNKGSTQQRNSGLNLTTIYAVCASLPQIVVFQNARACHRRGPARTSDSGDQECGTAVC